MAVARQDPATQRPKAQVSPGPSLMGPRGCGRSHGAAAGQEADGVEDGGEKGDHGDHLARHQLRVGDAGPSLPFQQAGGGQCCKAKRWVSQPPTEPGREPKKSECTRIRIRRHPSTTRSECGCLRLVSFPSGGKRIHGGWAWKRTAGEPAAPPAGDAEGLGHELLEEEGEGCQPHGGQRDLLGGAGGAPLNGGGAWGTRRR